MKIADRVNKIEVSQTTKMFAKAIELKESGVDIINLGVGEPDFETPANIREAGIDAINSNKTKYTINSGILSLRQAICNQLKSNFNLNYSPDEIIVSNGAKNSVYNALQTIINPDDEVILPAPYWVSYSEMIKLADGKPVIIETEEKNRFKISVNDFENAITDKTKALILCNPSNPTGVVYSKQELEPIANLALKHGIVIIADEIYQKLVYDNTEVCCLPTLGEEIKNNTILVNGVSKSYSMTGWRIGYAAGPKNVIDGMNKLQSHMTSNAASISQYAALEAYAGNQDDLEKMRQQFEKRRNFLYAEINKIDGLSSLLPKGAFYIFVNIKKLLTKNISTSYDFSMYCLENFHIAGVPGSAFGAEGYYRLSYATSMQNLAEAIKRIKKAVESLK